MAIIRIGGATSASSTTAGTSKTITYSPTAGNTLVVFAAGVGAAISNVTDNGGSVYSQRVGPVVNTVRGAIWSTEVGGVKAGVTTITVTFASSTRNACVCEEYSGVVALGKTNTATGSSTAPSVSITTEDANDFVVAGFSTQGTSTITQNAGTLRNSLVGAGSTTPGVGMSDNTAASAGNVTDSVTLGTTGAWVALALELRASNSPAVDEENVGWWAGVQQCLATVAIAASLTIASTGATVGQQIAVSHQDDAVAPPLDDDSRWPHSIEIPANWNVLTFGSSVAPAPAAAFVPDDDPWLTPVPPVLWYSPPVTAYLPDPEELPAATLSGQPDEDFWQNPVAPIGSYPVPLVFTADDTFTSIRDEDFWNNPVAPISSYPVPQLFNVDDPFTFATVQDEDFWQNPVLPVPFTLRPLYLPDPEEIPATSLHGQPDEDFWNNPVAPVPLTFGKLYLPDPEELPATTLHGQPDEDYWINPTAPIPASLWQKLPYLPDPEEIPAGSLIATSIGTDEDFWQNPVAPVPASMYQSLPYRLPLSDVEELPSGSLHGQPDEDFWQNQVAPVASYPVPFVFRDDDTVFATPVEDEDFWQNPVAPVPFTLRPLYLPDPEELPARTLSGQPDEDFWRHTVVQRSQWNTLLFGSSWNIPPITGAPFLDEDFWQNPVAPVASYPPPRVFTYDDIIARAPVVTQFDEDFWQNPVAPVSGSDYQRLPYQPDPEEIPGLIGPTGFTIDADTWPHNVVFPASWRTLLFGSSVAVQPSTVPSFVEGNEWTNPVRPQPLFFGTLYLPDPEELPRLTGPAPANPIDEYWQNPVAPVIAANYQRLPYLPDPEEIPAGNLVGPAFTSEEEFSAILVVPADPLQQILLFLDDGSSVTSFQPDEDYAVNQTVYVPPVSYQVPPQAFTYDDVIATPPTTIDIDEDFWQNPVAPVPNNFGRLYLPDPEEIPTLFGPPPVGEPDEDFWQNQTPSVPASLWQRLPYLPDPEELPANTLHGQPDEDYWQNPVAPQPYSLWQRLPYGSLLDPDEIPVGNFFGQADEDYWQNPVFPVPASLYQRLPYLPDPEEIPAGKLYELEEEYWQNPVTPVSSYPKPIVFAVEDDLLVIGVEEDLWINPVVPVQYLPPVQAITDDEIIAIPPPIQDEDFWINPVAPIASYPVPVIFNEDVGLVVPPPIQDEDFWINPVAPVPWTFGPIYLPDPDQTDIPTIIPTSCIGSGTIQTVIGIGKVVQPDE